MKPINLKNVLEKLWSKKWVLFTSILIFSLASIFLAINLPNYYRSEAVLFPVESQGGSALGGLGGQLGGIASLAGVELNNDDNTGYAIEVLKSRSFIVDFINKYELKPKMFAVESWDRHTRKLNYSPEIYDEKRGTWLREVSYPLTVIPSDQESFKLFKKELLTIEQDSETKTVKIIILHQSPDVAKFIVDNLVNEINERIRLSDIEEANKSIAYLQETTAKIKITELNSVLYNLIQQNIQKRLLAEVREQYVFKTIDPAVAAEIHSKPTRSLICIVGALLGLLVSSLSVLSYSFWKGEL